MGTCNEYEVGVIPSWLQKVHFKCQSSSLPSICSHVSLYSSWGYYAQMFIILKQYQEGSRRVKSLGVFIKTEAKFQTLMHTGIEQHGYVHSATLLPLPSSVLLDVLSPVVGWCT